MLLAARVIMIGLIKQIPLLVGVFEWAQRDSNIVPAGDIIPLWGP
jgi:hypothetical protein